MVPSPLHSSQRPPSLLKIAHLLGQGLLGKELAYLVVGLEVGDGIGAGGLAYGILVDKLHSTQHANIALQFQMLTGAFGALAIFASKGLIQDVAHERSCRYR